MKVIDEEERRQRDWRAAASVSNTLGQQWETYIALARTNHEMVKRRNELEIARMMVDG